TVTQAVHAVNVSPSTDVAPNATIDFSAAAVDAHGHLVVGAPGATWQSDNAGVTFPDTGIGHAVIGDITTLTVVTITATISDVQGTATLTVDPALTPVDHIVI